MHQPPRPELRPDDIDVVDLDEEDSLDDAAEEAGSTMQAYLKAVQARLKYELKPNFPALEKKWLLAEINSSAAALDGCVGPARRSARRTGQYDPTRSN